MKLAGKIDRLVAHRFPLRNADQLERSAALTGDAYGVIADVDSFEVCLCRTDEKDSPRSAHIQPPAEKCVIDNLADIRRIVIELPADLDEMRRHRNLRHRQSICFIDLLLDLGVRRERAFISLTEMNGAIPGESMRVEKRLPECSDDEVVRREIGVVP